MTERDDDMQSLKSIHRAGRRARSERPRRRPALAAGPARHAAPRRFAGLGFPTVRDEEWRFTSVAPIAAATFAPASAPTAGARGCSSAPAVRRRRCAAAGRSSTAGSRRSCRALAALPRGRARRVAGRGGRRRSHADAGRARISASSPTSAARAFTALNTALRRGRRLRLTSPTASCSSSRIADPVRRRSPTASRSMIASAHADRRSASAARRGSSRPTSAPATRSTSPTRSPRSSSARTPCSITTRCSRRASDAFHIASMHVHAARSANFSSHSFSLGGKLVRNDALAHARRRRRRVHAERPLPADGDQLVDNHTTIDHAKPHCASHELYKGILGGQARAVFNGKIIVRQDAQKTDAKQTNKALLLSDDATINTKPQLEIFADDVKCTHGAAIGQLDEDAIFYLRARGLTFYEARDMLIHAFAGDILDRVKIEPLRRALERELYAQLAQRSRGGRPTTMTPRCRRPARRVRRRADPRRLPDPAPPGPRQAAGLSRQRRHDAEAAGGARRADALLRRRQRQRPPRRAPLSERATEAYEEARDEVRRFLNAARARGDHLHAQRHRGDQPRRARRSAARDVGSRATRCSSPAMEHHSNIVPWQMLCEERGARLRVVPIDDRGELIARRARGAARRRARGSWRSRTCRTRSARSIRSSDDRARWRTRAASRCWSTARRRRTTCRSTCRRSTATSTP